MYISGSKQLPVASLDPGACDAFMMNVLIEFDMCCHVCFSLFYLKPKKVRLKLEYIQGFF